MNYTKEQTEYVLSEYKKDPTRETVDRLGEELKKSPKSIIGKLSREGVYRKVVYQSKTGVVYQSKTGEDPITKVELVHDISDTLRTDYPNLQGLEKAPKGVLKCLQKLVSEIGS
jgi:hypothetical protein